MSVAGRARGASAISASSSASISRRQLLQPLERLAGGRSSTENCRRVEIVAASRSRSSVAQRARALGRDAEDRAQDHLERDRLHARVDRRTPGPRGQRVELALGRLAHDRLVRAHPVAVERRQHHLAAREVLGALEQQQRARADQRPQRTVRPGGSPWPRSPYSARIASGWETITSGVLKPRNVTLNVSP